MQSNKASKKTSKHAAETASVAATPLAPETAGNARVARSSKSKSESSESITVKRHRKAANTVVPSAPEVPVESPVPVSAALVADAQPVVQNAGSHQGAPGYHEIAALAHTLWEQRGRPHGGHEDDWFRAEQQLLTRRASA